MSTQPGYHYTQKTYAAPSYISTPHWFSLPKEVRAKLWDLTDMNRRPAFEALIVAATRLAALEKRPKANPGLDGSAG